MVESGFTIAQAVFSGIGADLRATNDIVEWDVWVAASEVVGVEVGTGRFTTLVVSSEVCSAVWARCVGRFHILVLLDLMELV